MLADRRWRGPRSPFVTLTRGSKWMRRGERAPSDIPLENKQNKSQLLQTGTQCRFIKLTSLGFFLALSPKNM